MKKIPEVTAIFWLMKICATTLGETAGDLLSMTLKIGYAASSIILVSLFLFTFLLQLTAKKYHPVLYWLVILSTSTAGTTMSDYLDRTVGLGYMTGSLLLMSCLIIVLLLWRFFEKSLSIDEIKSSRGELFYWLAILFSNTLGTAVGDFLADSSGLGFFGGALLIAGLLILLIVLHFKTNFSNVILFWSAFVLTRPFGATFGDLLTKSHEKGGLNLGTQGSSLVLFCILLCLILFTSKRQPSSA